MSAAGSVPAAELVQVSTPRNGRDVVVRTAACMQTPEQRRRCSFGVGPNPATPEPKRPNLKETPPPAPRANQQKDEIDDALRQQSKALLGLALLQGHLCSTSDPVFEAVRQQHARALEFLLGCGAPADEHCFGRRPLHLAVQQCTVEGDPGHRMVELLLKHGARPNQCVPDDPRQLPPLHAAAQKVSATVAELLLTQGADPNQADDRGDLPLHLACHQVQLANVANLNIDDFAVPADTSPSCHLLRGLEVATEQLVVVLLRHGADPCRVDATGLPPLACVPRHICHLRDLFSRATRWWNRCALTTVCSRSHSAAVELSDAKMACLGHPDIISQLIACL